ncbi:caspase domain protein [Synechococcus sp. PCC 7335]|uniref:caspase family protein n=1 Tax=Synechococcus sp. (strain ATCC 29403 / PCC 7335) TaxID=91464 RepID=UPI00017EE77D|nr:caspase family protein [Synechococcus sp. PCC 7335]EDX87436.1 caspase domain protein [Synechococcus sp. PCC 7335]
MGVRTNPKVTNRQGLSRRSFFRQTGVALAALGLTELLGELAVELAVPEKAKAYGEALGRSGARKLALLIGINDYPSSTVPSGQSDDGKLFGAQNDVALQRELLIHRFGFLPEDIVSLTDAQATREGIYQAFVNHLYRQVESGDVVVVHFSGHGSQVRIEDRAPELSTGELSTSETVLQRTLVPVDGLLPTPERPTLNDISEVELKTLLRLLKTKNVTTVIDAGFVDMNVPLSGGLRSRTRSEIPTGQRPASFPLLADQRLMKESDDFPGMLIRGGAIDEVVLERRWHDFNAGAFTYVMTQYLWSAPAPVMTKRVLARSQETLVRWGGSNQQPIASGPIQATPIYYTSLIEQTRASAVVTEVSSDGKTATLWLGGLPPRVLEYLGSDSVMTCQGHRLKMRSHNALSGKAQLTEDAKIGGALQPGQLAFEAIRVLPKDINLVVALDSRLERIERVDATSALSALSFISSTSATDLPADCLLAKPIADDNESLTASLYPTQLVRQQAQLEMAQSDSGADIESPVLDQPADISNARGYGLFSVTRSPISGTLAQQEEAIKPAINRLAPKLRSLAALKLLRLTGNRSTSKLSVRVVLEQVEPKQNKLLVARQTFQASQDNDSSIEGFIPTVPVGSRVRYQLFNEDSVPLYYTLINVDPRERLSIFYPAANERNIAVDIDEENIPEGTLSSVPASIAPGSSVFIPTDNLDWAVENPAGPVETYAVFSARPLTETDSLLRSALNSRGQRISPLPNPLEVVKAMLSDLSTGSETSDYLLDVSQWATLNFAYKSV